MLQVAKNGWLQINGFYVDLYAGGGFSRVQGTRIFLKGAPHSSPHTVKPLQGDISAHGLFSAACYASLLD